MKLMKQTITLEVLYDEDMGPPSDWDWEGVWKMKYPEWAEVINSTTPERVDN